MPQRLLLAHGSHARRQHPLDVAAGTRRWRRAPRVPLKLPRLGCREDERAERSLRNRPGASQQRPCRGHLLAQRSVRAPPSCKGCSPATPSEAPTNPYALRLFLSIPPTLRSTLVGNQGLQHFATSPLVAVTLYRRSSNLVPPPTVQPSEACRIPSCQTPARTRDSSSDRYGKVLLRSSIRRRQVDSRLELPIQTR